MLRKPPVSPEDQRLPHRAFLPFPIRGEAVDMARFAVQLARERHAERHRQTVPETARSRPVCARIQPGTGMTGEQRAVGVKGAQLLLAKQSGSTASRTAHRPHGPWTE